jgi:5-formyltetrahydrofolate cyclo-ligase
MTRPVFEAKRLMRIRCRRIRSELGEEHRWQASLAICTLIEHWQEFESAKTILTYMPMQGEVDLRPLLERHPAKNWVLPRILSQGRMVFHPYDPARLVHHPYGMLEPAPDLLLIQVEAIQLAFVPGLAFDFHGGRLGYGGGYFDRFLAAFQGVSIGITYQALKFEHLPLQKNDRLVDYLVTENGLAVSRGRKQH